MTHAEKLEALLKKRNAISKAWRLRNKERVNSYRREFYKQNPIARVRHNLRKRISRALRDGTYFDNLGCSIEHLKQHLESQFSAGMTWENYGKTGWHVDHIVPLSAFDLTNPEQVKLACNFKNLQPLWAVDNLKKGGANGT